MNLQVFRNEKGIIVCIKCGWMKMAEDVENSSFDFNTGEGVTEYT